MTWRDDLVSRVKACTNCPLHTTRTQAVPGWGSETAKVMFLGEAPGKNEDIQGRPFVGQAGRILTEALAKVGWSREDVYITNLVKCRPPNNRDPQPPEVRSCRSYFEEELQHIGPLLVVLLGRHALAAVSPSLSISKYHGKPFRKISQNQWYFPSYHPAATLYSHTLRATFEADIAIARKHLDWLENQE